MNPRDCDDGEPCTKELCEDGVCAYELLPNQTVCGSDTGVSACLNGTCQLIWTTCNEDGAQDGDFCHPRSVPGGNAVQRAAADRFIATGGST